MKKSCLLLLTLVAFTVSAQVKFLFVGDVMQHGGQIQGAYNAKKDAYDYRDCFQFVKPVIYEADIAVANLEVTHAGKPYKGYPQFSAPPELSEALVDAGFDVILTANNHSCDGGGKGVTKTLDELDKLGVKHTGTFRNKAERDKNYPLMVEKNGLKVAVLNYTYGTNGLKVAAPLIINYIDSAVMQADFKKAKTLGADIIVCTMHWGTEYQSLPNDYQQKWEAFCYRHGADMVIGGHPHVLQPVEKKTVGGKEKLTAWSLGNFVSNQRDRYKDGGMMLTATVSKDSSGAHFDDVSHYFTWVFPRQEAVVKPYYILPEFDYNAYRSGFLDSAAKQQMQLFFSDSRALFAKHAKGTTERTIVTDSRPGITYRFLLGGYYTVRLNIPEVGTDWKKLTPETKKLVFKILGADGSYYFASGMFRTQQEAMDWMPELKGLPTLGNTVWYVSPSEFKLVYK
jgi:poly-gamma-glutamate synthesis protein (capsule biosynthesis protein)